MSPDKVLFVSHYIKGLPKIFQLAISGEVAIYVGMESIVPFYTHLLLPVRPPVKYRFSTTFVIAFNFYYGFLSFEEEKCNCRLIKVYLALG